VNLTGYQYRTTETLSESLLPIGCDAWTAYVGLQLVSETGEILGKFAKWVRDDGGDLRDVTGMDPGLANAIMHEVGDLLYFLAQVGVDAGWEMHVEPLLTSVDLEEVLVFLSQSTSAMHLYLMHEGYSREVLKQDWNMALSLTAKIASMMGYTLYEVALMNQNKLASRQSRGKISGSGDRR
jgi:hypothetical protein